MLRRELSTSSEVQSRTLEMEDYEWSYMPATLQSSCIDLFINNISYFLAVDHFPGITTESCLSNKVATNEFAPASTEAAADLPTTLSPCASCSKNRMVLTVRLAEMLLSKLSFSDKLTDDTLRAFIKLYDYQYRRLHLALGNLLTIGDVFSKMKLYELTLSVSPNGCANPNLIVKDLISSFHNSSTSLRALELDLILVSRVRGRGDIVDFVTTFPNLKVLRLKSEMRVGSNVFDSSTWERLLCECRQLEVLSVSFPRVGKKVTLDSSLFHRYGKGLRSIGLYNALSLDQNIELQDSLSYFGRMNTLTHLDISIDVEPELVFGDIHTHHDESIVRSARRHEIFAKRVEQLLELGREGLPSLVSLDLSGILRLNDTFLERFLNTHKLMSFLGLCLTTSMYCLKELLPRTIKVTGIHLERQIIQSLILYPTRGTYLKEALKGLFHISSDWTKRRPEIIELVLRSMQDHSSSMLLQMAGTACLYNLTREREDLQGEDVHITLLNKTAELTATALTEGLGTIQIVKNCLLIFCNDRILHQAKFDRFKMIRVCLDCMSFIPESADHNVTRMAVAIVSILACKITSHETATLTTEKDMKLLLELLRRRVQSREVDGTLKFDLSALWNLTDESPKACEMFVNNGGMDLYVNILQVFLDHTVQTKVLGLLNNIAEVDYLLDSLLRMDLLRFVVKMISDERVAVSYFSAGIVANLLYVWKDDWSTRFMPKLKLSSKLALAVKKWGTLDYEIVTYRSFRPFLNLLKAYYIPEVQIWAVWAIHHVCSLNPHRYTDVLTDECYNLMLQLKDSSLCCDDTRTRILEVGKVSKRLPK